MKKQQRQNGRDLFNIFKYFPAVYNNNDITDIINSTWISPVKWMTELAHCELLIMLSSFKLFFLLKCKLAYYESFLATVASSIDSVCYNSKVPTKTQPEHEQSTVTTIPPSVYRCIICLDSLRLDTKTFYNSHYCGQQARYRI